MTTLKVLAARESGFITIRSVARAAGVAPTTVSKVYRRLAKHGIIVRWYIDYTPILKQDYLLISVDENRRDEILQILKSDPFIAELHIIRGFKGYNVLAKIVGINKHQIELHLSKLESQLEHIRMTQIDVISTLKTRPRLSQIITNAYHDDIL